MAENYELFRGSVMKISMFAKSYDIQVESIACIDTINQGPIRQQKGERNNAKKGQREKQACEAMICYKMNIKFTELDFHSDNSVFIFLGA